MPDTLPNSKLNWAPSCGLAAATPDPPSPSSTGHQQWTKQITPATTSMSTRSGRRGPNGNNELQQRIDQLEEKVEDALPLADLESKLKPLMEDYWESGAIKEMIKEVIKEVVTKMREEESIDGQQPSATTEQPNSNPPLQMGDRRGGYKDLKDVVKDKKRIPPLVNR
jgi:hypothetical protein